MICVIMWAKGEKCTLRDFISGTYRYQIDDKGRIRIPAKIKNLLGEKLWISVGDQENLVIYTEKTIDQLYDKYGQLESDDPAYRKQRYIFANTFRFQGDSQDRFQIPQILRDLIGLKNEALFVGMANRVEIWREDTYLETLARDNPNRIIRRTEGN